MVDGRGAVLKGTAVEVITGTKGISFLWAMPLGLAVQVGVGAIVSLLPFGRRPNGKAW